MKRKILGGTLAALMAAVLVCMLGITAHAEPLPEYRIEAGADGEYRLLTEGRCIGEGTLQELLSALPTDAEGSLDVFFDEITARQTLTVTQDVRLSGALTVTDGARLEVCEGAEVTLSSLSLSFSGTPTDCGYVRIKDGTLTVDGGAVHGEGHAVAVLDYAASARLVVKRGRVSCSGAQAVLAETGTVELLGGEIVCSDGYAVRARSTVRLGAQIALFGSEFELWTDRPLWLSCQGTRFSSAVRIHYDTHVDIGGRQVVLLGASPEAIGAVSLFDAQGVRMPLSYAAQTDGEVDVGLIDRPFTVRFLVDSSSIGETHAYVGEPFSPPTPPTREGYVFDGWYMDVQGTSPFTGCVTQSTAIYARYRLMPPSYRLSSVAFTYDGATHALRFEGLSHPCLDAGVLQYVWYKDGAPLSEVRDALPIRTVADSGVYRCCVTLTVGADTVSVTTEEVAVSVSPYLVAPPRVSSVPYTGRAQTAEITPSALYTVLENGGGVHAGRYPVRLQLTDPLNTAWREGTGDTWDMLFVIEQAINAFVDPPSVSDVFEGQSPSVCVAAKYGKCNLLFANNANGPYLSEPPRTAGAYFLAVTVDGCDDYTALSSRPIPFLVHAVVPQTLRLLTPPDRVQYTAFERFSADGLRVSAVMNDGTERELSADALTVLYTDGRDSLRVQDAFVTVCYGELRLPVAVSVGYAVYDLSQLRFDDGEAVYNGRTQTLSVRGTLPVGEDGQPLCVTYTGGGCTVGVYDVYAVFSTESDQYRLPERMHARLTVAPCSVRVRWTVETYVYDGTAHVPTATATDLGGRPLSLTVTGAAIKASDAYVAYCTADDANYTVENGTCPFTVRKAVYDMSAVRWEGGDFLYDGTVHTVSLTGLPSGVRAVGFTDVSATDAGRYTARCTLLYDEENYEAPEVLPYTYEVHAASYDMSGVSFPPCVLVYTGEVQYPLQVGQLPVGADGSQPRVCMDGGAVNVSDGTVCVTVRFVSDSGNYLSPLPVTSSVTVVPLAVDVSWEVPDFTYDGRMHAPIAVCDAVSVTVTGAQTNAGVHVAYAYADDGNYTVRNGRCVFSIARATNAWLVPPTVADTFLGRLPSVQACAVAGEVTVAYFRDAACLEAVDAPTEAGLYYAVVAVREEINYEDLIGEPIAFRMIEVVPTELLISLPADGYLAFERVDDRAFSAVLLYNDGHTETLAPEALTVTYAQGTSFRCGDTQVTLSAAGLTACPSVKVSKAPLPLTGVSWTGEGLTYTGEVQTVTLVGLPDGVRVSSYEGNRAKNAGEYTASAVLDFDRDNFTHEGVLYYTYTVARAVVPMPTVPSAVYNGKRQTASVPPSALYTVTDAAEGTHAGAYPVSVALVDADNYCFANGTPYAEPVFTVLPRPLTVTVEDVLLYTDRAVPQITYRITEGEACEGDALAIRIAVEDGVLTARADNPDYEITFVLGRVVDTGRLSPEGRRLVFLCVALFLAVCLLLLAASVWRYRYRLRRATVRSGRMLPPSAAVRPLPPPVTPLADADADTPADGPSFEEARLHADALLRLCEPSGAEQKTPPLGHGNGLSRPTDTVGSGGGSVEQAMCAVDAVRADALISDDLAGHLVGREPETVETYGHRRVILNVDALRSAFSAGERVDVNVLKERYLIPYDTGYLKILAGGILDKALEVYADSFSLQAVKMIALTGGHAIRAVTVGKDTARRKKTGKRAKRH